MELNVTNFVLIALFIEAIVQAVKPIWDKEAQRLSVPECISMAVGVLVAVLAKINMLDGIITAETPALLYTLYALSGIAVGRGPSFVHDLWSKLKTFGHDEATQASENAATIAAIIQRVFGQAQKPTDAEPLEKGGAE